MMAIVGTRTTHDDITLATRHWTAADPRAAIVLVHGLAEHTGRYDHVADRFTSRGLDVRGTDLRGFGRSGGERAYVEDFSEYTTDLADDITAAHDLDAPVVLLGHSLGGLIAILYATEDHPQPDLLVLSAPAIDAELPRVKALAAKALGRVLPRLKVSNGLKGEQLSRDPTVGERYFADRGTGPGFAGADNAAHARRSRWIRLDCQPPFLRTDRPPPRSDTGRLRRLQARVVQRGGRNAGGDHHRRLDRRSVITGDHPICNQILRRLVAKGRSNCPHGHDLEILRVEAMMIHGQ